MEFIDEYRLLISFRSTIVDPLPSLVLMDTERETGGNPIQTTFRLPGFRWPTFISDSGVHTPFPAVSPAPFHQDPSQRLIVLDLRTYPSYLVLQVEKLLKLSRDREGTDVRWNEWKDHITVPWTSQSCWIRGPRTVYVSGCFLTFVNPAAGDAGVEMEVFDFGVKGRTRRFCKEIGGFGVMDHLSSVGGKVPISLGGFVEGP